MILVYVCALDITSKNGALNHVLGVVNGLSALGLDVTLVASSSDASVEIESPADCRIANTSGMTSPRALLTVSNLARKVIEELSPDCIYLRNYVLDYPLLVKHLGDIPVYLELNAVLEGEYVARRQFLRGKIYAFFQRKTIASATAWLPITSQVHKFCQDITGASKPHLLARNGVWVDDWEPAAPRAETRQSLGTPSSRKVLVMAGFEKVWHGWERAVEALRFLSDDYELWLIGSTDHSLRKQVEELASQNDVLDRVRIMGWLDKSTLANVICAADLGLGALALDRKNMTEAQALKIGTYLALGTPAFINCPDPRIPESNEIVALVQSTDAKEIATGLQEFLAIAESDRERIKEYARKNMDWQEVAQEVRDFIMSDK